MIYKDKIIFHVSDSACKQASAEVVRDLRKMTEGMQSGDDTPLKNIWDEICVQMQDEQSVMWDAYEDTMLRLIEEKLRKLDNIVLGAIFLQSDAGSRWEGEIEESNPENVDYDIDEIARHVMNEYILQTASNWNNRRIERFLDQGSSLK